MTALSNDVLSLVEIDCIVKKQMERDALECVRMPDQTDMLVFTKIYLPFN